MTPVILAIDANDNITLKGRRIDFRAIEANIEKEKAQNPDAVVLVSVHSKSSNEAMIKVVDAARRAGITRVNVSTESVALH